ncbi:Ig-like domain-containing protein [Streptomyces sp. NPDC050504]|uniref:Ig-like domain-containing protein n=1 Tax=Streptomyces sp. NPDC050504 TaxID=3365618 RepID=UPI00379354A7
MGTFVAGAVTVGGGADALAAPAPGTERAAGTCGSPAVFADPREAAVGQDVRIYGNPAVENEVVNLTTRTGPTQIDLRTASRGCVFTFVLPASTLDEGYHSLRVAPDGSPPPWDRAIGFTYGRRGTGAPAALDDHVSTSRNRPVRVDVLDNDSGDGIRLDGVTTAPLHGRTGVDGDRIVYTPAEGFVGTDRFRYRIRDRKGRTAQATVHVDVSAGEPGRPWLIVRSNGDGQKTLTGGRFAERLSVKVVDGPGDPLPDQQVMFEIQGNSGSVFATRRDGQGGGKPRAGGGRVTVPTNARGEATAPDIVAGPNPGVFHVRATVAGHEHLTTEFTLALERGGPQRLEVVGGDGQTVAAGEEFQPVDVVLYNAAGAPVAGQRVSFQIRGASGSTFSGSGRTEMESPATDSRGRTASDFITAGRRPGEVEVAITSPALPSGTEYYVYLRIT